VAPLPESQLIQARALLQDIRKFVREQTQPHYSTTDYRVIDVFRGLKLADKGLSALIGDKHYTEYEQMQEALRDWPDMSDENLG
jgi:hypothetical protein